MPAGALGVHGAHHRRSCVRSLQEAAVDRNEKLRVRAGILQNWTNSKLDESCISNPRLEISNWTVLTGRQVQFKISSFGFEMQDSSNFEFVQFRTSGGLVPSP